MLFKGIADLQPMEGSTAAKHTGKEMETVYRKGNAEKIMVTFEESTDLAGRRIFQAPQGDMGCEPPSFRCKAKVNKTRFNLITKVY